MDFEDIRLKGFSKRMKYIEALQYCYKMFPRFSEEEIMLENTSISNKILRRNVYAKRSIPPFDRSAVDGYAVLARDTIGASEVNPLILRVIATLEIGQKPNVSLKEKTAIQIPTGGVIPEGADAVIMIEDTSIISEDLNEIEIYTSIHPGKNIAKAGEDLKQNDLLLEKGKILRPVDRSFLLSAGVTRIYISKTPTIGIISTGDELVEAWSPTLELGKIPDTNSINLYEFCCDEGWKASIVGIIGDDENLLRKSIKEASENFDVLLITGGSSVGKKDYIPSLLNELGTLIFHGISIRPGGPISAAIINNKIILGLPGFPAATLIAYQFLVRPVIYKLMGLHQKYNLLTIKAMITRNVGSKLGRLDFLRVKIEKNSKGKYLAIPIQIGGSGLLRSIVHGNGIVPIAETSEGLKQNDVVDVIILDPYYIDFTPFSRKNKNN